MNFATEWVEAANCSRRIINPVIGIISKVSFNTRKLHKARVSGENEKEKRQAARQKP
jgi:hypothetical protein